MNMFLPLRARYTVTVHRHIAAKTWFAHAKYLHSTSKRIIVMTKPAANNGMHIYSRFLSDR